MLRLEDACEPAVECRLLVNLARRREAISVAPIRSTLASSGTRTRPGRGVGVLKVRRYNRETKTTTQQLAKSGQRINLDKGDE